MMRKTLLYCTLLLAGLRVAAQTGTSDPAEAYFYDQLKEGNYYYHLQELPADTAPSETVPKFCSAEDIFSAKAQVMSRYGAQPMSKSDPQPWYSAYDRNVLEKLNELHFSGSGKRIEDEIAQLDSAYLHFLKEVEDLVFENEVIIAADIRASQNGGFLCTRTFYHELSHSFGFVIEERQMNGEVKRQLCSGRYRIGGDWLMVDCPAHPDFFKPYNSRTFFGDTDLKHQGRR